MNLSPPYSFDWSSAVRRTGSPFFFSMDQPQNRGYFTQMALLSELKVSSPLVILLYFAPFSERDQVSGKLEALGRVFLETVSFFQALDLSFLLPSLDILRLRCIYLFSLYPVVVDILFPPVFFPPHSFSLSMCTPQH